MAVVKRSMVISRGVLGTPKSPDRSPKGVSDGALGAPRDVKRGNGYQQCMLKIVTKQMFGAWMTKMEGAPPLRGAWMG